MTRAELIRIVAERYGSLETPDFHWVALAYERDPFRAVKVGLGELFMIEDVTDLNFDVSCAYDVRTRVGSGTWTLRLSMVGPYAALLRWGGARAEAIVNGPDDARNEAERAIVTACQASGCEVLTREMLNWPVELRLFDTAPDRVRCYQALFCDVDIMPGEYVSLPGMEGPLENRRR